MKKTLYLILFLSLNFYSFSQENLSDTRENNIKIKFKYYSVTFNKIKRQALLVNYTLTSDMLIKNVKRKNYYYSHSNGLNTLTNKDFKRSGFDRGHLVPAADMLFDEQAMRETFHYLNISFQYPSFNRGIWKTLENKVRKHCLEYDTVYVVIGTIFSNDIENETPLIPEYYFKAILVKSGNLHEAAAFVIPNLKRKSEYGVLSSYIYPIDKLELLTGYDFFPELNDLIETEIESYVNYIFWFD